MEDLSSNFEKEAKEFLNNVNQENFFKSYDGLINIILKYKDQGLTKKEVIKVIGNIDSLELDKYKEDVLIEISSRVEGMCSSSLAIKWD